MQEQTPYMLTACLFVDICPGKAHSPGHVIGHVTEFPGFLIVYNMAASMAYHRRLDRGPEKDEFKRLSREDKELVSQLRGAMEGTREKMSTLRDEVDNR